MGELALPGIAKLLKDNKRLQRENAELQSNNQLLAVRLDSTIAKLAATEADTKRLDWVAVHSAVTYNVPGNGWRVGILVPKWEATGTRQDAFRAAIDAARGDKGE